MDFGHGRDLVEDEGSMRLSMIDERTSSKYVCRRQSFLAASLRSAALFISRRQVGGHQHDPRAILEQFAKSL